jgi:hypothetical protein
VYHSSGKDGKLSSFQSRISADSSDLKVKDVLKHFWASREADLDRHCLCGL